MVKDDKPLFLDSIERYVTRHRQNGASQKRPTNTAWFSVVFRAIALSKILIYLDD
jgi:hypothetical protein